MFRSVNMAQHEQNTEDTHIGIINDDYSPAALEN